MTGPIAQIVALTAYGNDYLKNGKLPSEFYPANTTFQFCNKVDFRTIKKSLFSSKFNEVIVTENPVDWLHYLKKDGCRFLRLHYESSQKQPLGKDFQLAAFVGGGGTWLIEAVYQKYSNYWANRWQVTDQNAADRKIWTVNYGLTHKHEFTRNVQNEPDFIKDKLRQSLTEIADFAFKQNMPFWGNEFEKAKKVLDSPTPEVAYYHKDLVPLENYSRTAKQILFTAGVSWVFGGMGSWNDQGFTDQDINAEYERLTQQLYWNVTGAIVAAANSY